mgnify:CR=1 FL=1
METNWNKFEIIVINDASTDRTKEILENYLLDVRVYNLENNVGLSAARNFGLRKSKGQFAVFLDADDFIHTNLIELQKFYLEQNNKLDAVSVNYYTTNQRGEHIDNIDATKSPIACGIMFRKDLLFEIGLYDESFKAREEEDLRIRFLKKYNIYNIILPLYRYRMHGENLTANKEKMDTFANLLNKKHEWNGIYEFNSNSFKSNR